jgi:hypothetical protein
MVTRRNCRAAHMFGCPQEAIRADSIVLKLRISYCYQLRQVLPFSRSDRATMSIWPQSSAVNIGNRVLLSSPGGSAMLVLVPWKPIVLALGLLSVSC